LWPERKVRIREKVGCKPRHAAFIDGNRELKASVVFQAVPVLLSNCTRFEVRYKVGK
jgi:hypothetical protein